MKMGIMITDGGTHSPELQAANCAEMIFDYSQASDLSSDRLLAARRIEIRLIDALIPFFDAAKGDAVTELANPDSLFARTDLYDPGPRLDAAVVAVRDVFAGSEWDAAIESKTAEVRTMIANCLVAVAHDERKTWSDAHPEHEAAKAYASQPSGIVIIPS